MTRKILSLVLILMLVASFSTISASERPENIIFLIGDGMGVGQISATRILRGTLALEEFKVMGLHATASHDKLVTDSAAAGTALATGYKTIYNRLGNDPDGKPLKNLFEYAKEAGLRTGIVVTCTMTHATPGAFSAHVDLRKYASEIALQQVNDSGMSLIIGGGMRDLLPQSAEGSRRKDDINLVEKLKERMPVVTTYKELAALKDTDSAAAILDMGMLPKASDRDYSLGDMLKKGLEIITSNEKGFVLMVEGSQIDFAGHDNDLDRVVSELVDFDAAVRVALDFAKKDGKTLVVVTADHETGGITLPDEDTEDLKLKKASFSTQKHSGEMVPIFAYGPGAEKFGGIQDINDVGRKLIELVK